MQQAVQAPAIAWVGSIWSQQPELSLSEAGSLIVTSVNEAMGRTRRQTKLTIAYRNEEICPFVGDRRLIKQRVLPLVHPDRTVRPGISFRRATR